MVCMFTYNLSNGLFTILNFKIETNTTKTLLNISLLVVNRFPSNILYLDEKKRWHISTCKLKLTRGLGLWCLTPLSTLFVAVSFIGGGNQSTQREPPDKK